MAGFWGLDVQQMQRFETTLNDSAGEIRSIISELESLTAAVDWRGDDATEFKTKTWRGINDQLTKVAASLVGTATDVRTQVSQQTEASRPGR